MWKAMTTVAVLSLITLLVAACGAELPGSTAASQLSSTSSSGATPAPSSSAAPSPSPSATPVPGTTLCAASRLTTVYRQDLGIFAGTLGFVYTVRNTGSTTCGLSNAASLSGHQEETTSPLPPGTPTTVQLAAPTATAMPVRVVTQTPSMLPLAPGAEATLAMVAPESCPGAAAADHAYAEMTLTVPGIGPIVLEPDVAFVDCGAGSLSIQPWNPGSAPDLYVPPAG